MKHHPAYTALSIWFRGHVIFFIACLFVFGQFALFSSLIAFVISVPALPLYILLCIGAKEVKSFPLRFAVVLIAATLITHFSFIIGNKETDMSGGIDSWLHLAAIGSTVLSVVSAGYMMQNYRCAIQTEEIVTNPS